MPTNTTKGCIYESDFLLESLTHRSPVPIETVDNVGDAVIVQCVKEGSKLRARVVSDGYNPNWNIRFPRDIREESVLYVVDEVEEAKNGGSYVAYGKIRRLVQ